MRITNYLNTTEEAVRNKEFNICLGLSLGNRYFTPERIRSYLLWSVENTKDKVVVIIPDKIQAINYEVKNGYSPKRALAVAMRKGDELEATLRKIIAESHVPESKVHILHWGNLEDEHYVDTLRVIKEAFEHNQQFRNDIIQMVRETPHIQTLGLSEPDLVKLAQYIVNELPVLINGVTIAGEWYSLFPYPGFAKLDYLALDLQEGKTFPELTAKLDIRNKLRLIEAFAD
jgi:tRNA-dependent cyclodipeptide synthase